MKPTNYIAAIILATSVAESALANVDSKARLNFYTEEAQIAEIQGLLGRLYDVGAIEIDQYGNVHVKPSVLDQLKNEGRYKVMSSHVGSICD